MICKDCGKEFNISLRGEQYFRSKGLKLPKCCPNCRKARKAVKEQESKQLGMGNKICY